jgi:hypothetical protein
MAYEERGEKLGVGWEGAVKRIDRPGLCGETRLIGIEVNRSNSGDGVVEKLFQRSLSFSVNSSLPPIFKSQMCLALMDWVYEQVKSSLT